MDARSNLFVDDNTGWRALTKARTAQPKLERSGRVSKVVVGAGFSGLAAARELALRFPQERIAVLEARTVAAGASGRNAGYAVGVSQFGGAVTPDRVAECQRINRLNSAGLALLREAADPQSDHSWWRQEGFHYLAADDQSEREAVHFIANLRDFELPHRELDRAQIAAELGTQHYRCGVQVPLGALVQPAELLYRLVQRLPENVRIYEHSPVRAIKAGAHGVCLSLDGDVELRAEQLLLGCNYELPGLGFLRNRIAATTLSGSFTRPLSEQEMASLGSLRSWGVLGLHGGGATVRLCPDRRLMLRNCVEFNNGRLLSAAELAQRVHTHRERLQARFPQLAHVPIEHSWSGCEGVSRNMTSFFGQVAPGVYLAAGYNGSGLSRGTALGTALAQLSSGDQNPLISDAGGFAKAQWLPPRPLLDLGAAWSLRRRFSGVGEDI